MRRAVIIGFAHDTDHPEVISGPEVSIKEQRTLMRSLKQSAHHERFHRIEVWTSASRTMRKRFAKPGEALARSPWGDEDADESEQLDESENAGAVVPQASSLPLPPEPPAKPVEPKAPKASAPKKRK